MSDTHHGSIRLDEVKSVLQTLRRAQLQGGPTPIYDEETVKEAQERLEGLVYDDE